MRPTTGTSVLHNLLWHGRVRLTGQVVPVVCDARVGLERPFRRIYVLASPLEACTRTNVHFQEGGIYRGGQNRILREELE